MLNKYFSIVYFFWNSLYHIFWTSQCLFFFFNSLDSLDISFFFMLSEYTSLKSVGELGLPNLLGTPWSWATRYIRLCTDSPRHSAVYITGNRSVWLKIVIYQDCRLGNFFSEHSTLTNPMILIGNITIKMFCINWGKSKTMDPNMQSYPFHRFIEI